MKKIILLGAGASVDAGIPTAIGMTREMVAQFKLNKIEKESNALNFVVGGLLFKTGIKNEDPFNGVNIEEVFAATELLTNRNISEIFPFVGQWHPFIEQLERNKPKLSDKLRTFRDISDERQLHKFISKIDDILTEISTSPTGDIFRRTNRFLLGLLCRLVWIDDPLKVIYLSPLVKYASKKNVTIATLNYDNTIEVAAGDHGIKVVTGITSWINTGIFKKPTSGIEFLKLHGSIDWKIEIKRRGKDNYFPRFIVTKINKDEIEKLRNAWVQSQGFFYHTPGVIFGAGNKLTAKGPFLELFRTFKQRLEACDELIVIGYSFRDDHINELIYSWLNRKKKSKIVIVTRENANFSPNENWLEFCQKTTGRCEVLNIGAKKAIETLFMQK